LLKERDAARKGVADKVTKAFRIGKASDVQVYEANKAVRQAALDMSISDKDRMTILNQALAAAKENEEQAAQMFQVGQVTASTRLKARVERLEVEIAIERLRGNKVGQ